MQKVIKMEKLYWCEISFKEDTLEDFYSIAVDDVVLRKDNNCITTNKKKIYIDLDKINVAENINQNTKVNCLSFVDDHKTHYVYSLCFLYNDGEDVEFKKKIVKTLVAKELKKLLFEKIDSFNYSLSSLDNFVLEKD